MKIPTHSKAPVLERMNWNKEIYLIEIIRENKKKLKNPLWSRLFAYSYYLEPIRIKTGK